MNTKSRVTLALAAALFAAAPTVYAATSPYSAIVAFGDSLTDTGNFTALASGLSFGFVNFPSPAYGYAGEFAQALAPVPEAQTRAMLLAGLGRIVVAARLRGKRASAHVSALHVAV